MTAENQPDSKPANDLLPQPSAELLAHFNDPALRKRLLGKARWSGTPERRAEDVVHTTMTDAWRQRHLWPATPDELERWLFKALHNDMIDAARADKRMPLERKPKDAKDPEAGVVHDEDDGDPPAMTATTQLEPTLVARDGLRSANEYVESRPRLRKSFAWLMQNRAGASYADIAAKEGCDERVITNAVTRLRAELRMVFGPVAILVGFALIYILVRAMHGYVNDQANPDVPRPTPNIVAPPAPPPAPAPTTPPQLSASELRTRGLAECDAAEWAACYQDLTSASTADPAGETARVKAARAKAARYLTGKPQ
jgi:DNA-directed RNA polymerase specialized sigma24 family protein